MSKQKSWAASGKPPVRSAPLQATGPTISPGCTFWIGSNRLFILFSFVAAFWYVGGTAVSQSSKSPLPAPTGYVNDFAGVIDADTRSRLNNILTNLKVQQNIEFAAVTVRTTGGQDIFDYSLAVARGWGIGSKDTSNPSLLLLVAVDDHKYFTQVSRHLEGDLPDSLVGEIQRQKLVPPFRQGQFGKGIYDTMTTYVATLAKARGFSLAGIDQSTAPAARADNRSQVHGGGISPCVVVFIIIFVLILLSSMRRGGGGGCLNALLLGSLFSGSGRRSSGWGGGSFGGSSGGGGFGGFGGGGDFGGGGAGGSW